MLTATQWRLLVDEFGQSSHAALSVRWLTTLLHARGLVDTFAAAHGHSSRLRFTCWDQSSNSRYTNDGSRIDLILVDRGWWEELGSKESRLAGVEEDETEEAEKREGGWSEDRERRAELASLRACTANGRFQPASFASSGGVGRGIPEASAEAYQLQFREPHTGIIYTPPEYSDHVAVSMLIGLPNAAHLTRCKADAEPAQSESGDGEFYSLTLARDAATKLSQPHLQQSAITSFFHKGKSTSLSVQSSTVVLVPDVPKSISGPLVEVESAALEIAPNPFFNLKRTTSQTPSNHNFKLKHW